MATLTWRVRRLHVDGGLRRSIAAARTENIGSPTLELCVPRRDLVRTSNCSASLSLLIRRAQRARGQAEIPLVAPSRFSRPVLSDLVHFMPAMMMRLFSTGVEHRATTREML